MSEINNNRRITLKSLLFASFAGMLFVLLSGNFIVNITNASDYLEKQLGSHSQDAATSLGLSLSTVIDGSDLVAAGSMIDAFFDSGDYRHVAFYDVNNKPLIERSSSAKIQGVPEWFVQAVSLQSPVGEAEVVKGWKRLGHISVVSHPGYANVEMWNILKFQLMWFALVGALGYLILRYILSIVLKPLKSIEFQAKQISLNNFEHSSDSPVTEELYQVSKAMNSMSRRLSEVFKNQLGLIEQLREQNQIDALTGTFNREGFDGKLKAALDSRQDTTNGCLFVIQLSDFEIVNKDIGREAGDELLAAFGTALLEFLEDFPLGFCSRRGGANFAVFVPGILVEQVDEVAGDLLTRLVTIPAIKQRLRDDILHIGLAVTGQEDRANLLLSKADMALRQAQSRGQHGWKLYEVEESSESAESVKEAGQWYRLLQQAIQHRAISFDFQAVFGRKGRNVLFYQVLSRIDDGEQRIDAGQFIPMADKFSLMYDLDRLVVELVIESILSDLEDVQRYCINLSDSGLSDKGFVEWLVAVVQAHGQLRNRIIFDIPEYAMKVCSSGVNRFTKAAKESGFAICISRFGASGVPFSYLEHVDIDFIKVDQSIVRDIEGKPDNQFFLRTAVQIAHSQNIKLLVSGVETESELNALKSLGVDGVMGYYLARPVADADDQDI